MVEFRGVKTNVFHFYQFSVFISPPGFFMQDSSPLGSYIGSQIKQWLGVFLEYYLCENKNVDFWWYGYFSVSRNRIFIFRVLIN